MNNETLNFVLIFEMKLSDVFKQIKLQTLVGWTIGYLAAIVFNALLGQTFDEKFWLSLGGVLVVRILADLVFAIVDARKQAHPK